jgi:hypothetical protein
MDRTQQARARQIFTQATSLGIKLPKAVTDAHSRAENIRERSSCLEPGTQNPLGVVVADALARGVDPTTDPEVTRVIALCAIQAPGVRESVETAASTRLQDVYRDHADAIVEELREPFDQAVAELVKARERIGDHELTDTATILAKGDDIATVWAAAIEASRIIESAIAGWVALSMFLDGRAVDKRWLNLRLVRTTAAQYDDADLSNKKLTPWGAVLGGFELSLPTIAEYAERQAAIVQGRADQHEANLTRQKEASRRPSLLSA